MSLMLGFTSLLFPTGRIVPSISLFFPAKRSHLEWQASTLNKLPEVDDRKLFESPMSQPNAIKANPTVRTFAPEYWGEVNAFAHLFESTYSLTDRQKGALSGVSRHFEKALIFQEQAAKMLPALQEEQREMNQKGFTPGHMRQQAAQAVEACVNELYSSLDCTGKVVHAIYAKGSRGFRDSTSFLFDNADRITGSFPDELKRLFRGAGWESKLRQLRTELTHYNTGSCALDRDMGNMSYSHFGIREEGIVFERSNATAWLTEQLQVANILLGGIFHYLRGTLCSKPVVQMCGVVGGRGLIREVNPSERPLTFDSGRCMSLWIEDPTLPTCPFIALCGAYARTRPDQDPRAILASKLNPEPWAAPGSDLPEGEQS